MPINLKLLTLEVWNNPNIDFFEWAILHQLASIDRTTFSLFFGNGSPTSWCSNNAWSLRQTIRFTCTHTSNNESQIFPCHHSIQSITL